MATTVEKIQYDYSSSTSDAVKGVDNLNNSNEELAKTTEKTSKSQKENTSIMDSNSKSGQFLDGVTGKNITSMGALGVAVGVTTVAIKELTDNYNRNKEASATFAGNTNIAADETDALGASAVALGDTLGMDTTESLDTANDAVLLFGDSVKDTDDFTKAFIATNAINNSELFDTQEALSELDTLQSTYNSTLEESASTMATQVQLYQDFGSAADDSIDTINEWGDTFKAMGQDIDETMTTLAVGLQAGAKNTDEVANAYNEFALRVTEGSDDVIGALNDIGVGYDDLTDTINTEGINAGMLDVVNGLNNQYNALVDTEGEWQAYQDTLETAGKLFGTYGEEFVGTFATQTEQVQGLNNALAINKTVTSDVANVNSTILKPAYDNLTTTLDGNVSPALNRYNNILLTQGKGELLSTVIKENKLAPAINLVATNTDNLTKKQQFAVTQLAILTDSNSTWNEKLNATNTLLDTQQGKIIGQSAAVQGLAFRTAVNAKIESKSADIIANKSIPNVNSLVTATDKLNEKYGTQIYASGRLFQDSVNLNTANRNLTISQDQLNNVVTNAANGTYNYDKVIAFLNTTMGQNIAQSRLSSDSYQKLYDAQNKSTDATADATDGFTSSIREQKKAEKSTDEYNQKLEDSVTAQDRLKSGIDESTDAQDGFKTSTDNAKTSLQNLNTAISDYNDTPIQPKTATINTDSASASLNATRSSAGLSGNVSTTNINNNNRNVNYSINTRTLPTNRELARHERLALGGL